MKRARWYIFFSIFFFVNYSGLGQIGIGLKGGASIPCLIGTTRGSQVSNDYRSILVPALAVQFEFILSSNFSLRAQLAYAIEGGEKDGIQGFEVTPAFKQFAPSGENISRMYANYHSKLKIHYLSLPVQVMLHVELSHRWKAYFAGGLFISTPVAARNQTDGNSLVYLDEKQSTILTHTLQSFNGDENITSKLRRFNSGLTGGMGMSYTIKMHKLFFETGGNFGFVNIYKNKSIASNHTGAMIANIGYCFYFHQADKHMNY